jgi:hypothetical protein
MLTFEVIFIIVIIVSSLSFAEQADCFTANSKFACLLKVVDSVGKVVDYLIFGHLEDIFCIGVGCK